VSPEKRIQFLIDQKVSARDGTKLSVDVILPQGSSQFPTLLSRNPYESNSQRHLERAYWWAKNGYAFVSGDCRGRYESEGLFYPHLPDGSDGYDTLAWIACQPLNHILLERSGLPPIKNTILDYTGIGLVCQQNITTKIP